MRASPVTAVAEPTQRWHALALLSLATLLSLTVWFSTNAIAPALEAEKGFSKGDIAWLTIAVQLGFVFGTLAIAATNLADLVNTRTVFTVSAVLAGGANLALLFVGDSFAAAMAVRLLTGAFLGGVYPPGMKIVAGWFQSGRGIAIGTMLAALTLGSGSPHLLRAIFVAHWEVTLYISSIMAVAAGFIVYLLVTDGPFDVPAARFNPRYALDTLKTRASRLVLVGYLGHSWELYGMWTWVPVFLKSVYGDRSLTGNHLALHGLLAFLVFLAGTAGCVAGGLLAQRWGRCAVTSAAMIVSGGMALFIGFLAPGWGWVIGLVALVWGFSVIADSGQFSTAVTEITDSAYRGTALTFQTGLGFLLTIVTIRLVPVIQDAAGWGVAFAFLAIGPALGAAAMLYLRRLPESQAIADGRR